jgi:di/tricarboxylate transporter
MIEFAMIKLASKSPAVINCTVNKSKQVAILKILIFTRTSMTRQHTLFSDESRFSLCFSDGRYRVYRSRGERFTDQCVHESDRFGGGMTAGDLDANFIIANSIMGRKIDFPEFFCSRTGCHCLFCEDKSVSRKH